MHKKSVIIMSLLCFFLVTGGCASPRSFDSSLRTIVKHHRFSTARWEAGVIGGEVKGWLFGKSQKGTDETRAVNDYFSLVDQIKALKSRMDVANAGNRQSDLTSLRSELNKLEGQRASLEDAVEDIIALQIKAALAEQGIFNPVMKWQFHFPPLDFRLEKLPYLLVVSPRERIESMREVTLRSDLTLAQMEKMEAEVDKLGVSSLVVELGGYGGTYPTIVLNEADLRFIIDTAVEEWAHQYLTFTPLGFRYVLDLAGISRDYEIATMNETVVSMVSKEIGEMVCQKYYPEYAVRESRKAAQKPDFDFNREMREIRRAVDMYLAQGQIEQAEAFMKEKRQYLAEHGYYIRKLNQAYFAFHGTYADRPTSISPIGVELRQLRAQSPSLKDFLDRVSVMTSRQDLKASVKAQ